MRLDAGAVGHENVVLSYSPLAAPVCLIPRLFRPADLARPFLLRAPNTPDSNVGESAEALLYNCRVPISNWPRIPLLPSAAFSMPASGLRQGRYGGADLRRPSRARS